MMCDFVRREFCIFFVFFVRFFFFSFLKKKNHPLVCSCAFPLFTSYYDYAQ